MTTADAVGVGKAIDCVRLVRDDWDLNEDSFVNDLAWDSIELMFYFVLFSKI